MNNKEFIKALSIKMDKPQTETKKLLESCVKIIVDTVDKDIKVGIPSLGIFGTQEKDKRRSYDPHKKIMIMCPKKRLIKFSVSSVVKDEIKDKNVES